MTTDTPSRSRRAGPRAGIYLRVSTEDQNAENQLDPLLSMCKARRWEVHKVYRDVISGKTTDRLGVNEFLHDARVGKFQIALFWAWDRITRRGIKAALEFMEKFRTWGVAWESLQEPFLSSAADPKTSELLMAVLAWAAEQERIRISERTKAGMRLKKSQGVHVGRPVGSRDKKPRRKRGSPRGSP